MDTDTSSTIEELEAQLIDSPGNYDLICAAVRAHFNCIWYAGGEQYNIDRVEQLLSQLSEDDCLFIRGYHLWLKEYGGGPTKYLRKAAEKFAEQNPDPLDCDEFYWDWGKAFLDEPPDGLWKAWAKAFGSRWPNSALVHYLNGLAKKEKTEALSYYKAALEANPSFWLAAWQLAEEMEERKNWVNSFKFYSAALACKGARDIPKIQFKYAYCLGELNRRDEEQKAYRVVLDLDPDFPYARNNLGCSLLKVGLNTEAIDVFEEAIRRGNDGKCPLRNLGTTFEKLGRYQEAIDILSQDTNNGRLSKSASEKIGKLKKLLEVKGNLKPKPSTSLVAMPATLLSRFKVARTRLEQPEFNHVRDRSLHDKVSGKYKHLPRQWLDMKISEIIASDFEKLIQQPGVGRLKAGKLVSLLEDIVANHEHQPAISFASSRFEQFDTTADPKSLNVEDITESDWQKIRSNIISHGYGDYVLGLFVESLKELPRNMWEVPLRHYGSLSLREMRHISGFGRMKLFGVLNCFCSLFNALPEASRLPPHLGLHVRPKFVVCVEEWIRGCLNRIEPPNAEEIEQKFLTPVFFQVMKDGGEELVSIGRQRLVGGEGCAVSVIANDAGESRQSIHNKLVLLASILKVRWPEGQYLLDDLCDRIATQGETSEAFRLARDAFALFFPERRYQRMQVAAKASGLNPSVEGQVSTRVALSSDVEKDPKVESTVDSLEIRNSTNKTVGHRVVKESTSYINEAILALLGDQ